MAVLLLQPPYSFLFNEIGKNLIKNNIATYSLNFNLGDKFLKKDIPSLDYIELVKAFNVTLDDKELFEDCAKIDNLYKSIKKKIYKRELSVDEKKYFYRYVKILEDIIIKNNIDCILMQNDTRWQHALAIYVAKKMNIRYYVFELGLFRPNTITLDSKGVNYNNSVNRDENFYVEPRDYMTYEYKKIDSEITEKKRNIIFAIYILLYKWGELFKLNALENKPIQLRDYLYRFTYNYLYKKPIKVRFEYPRNFIFVPLQVNSDSQILIHSDYENMTDFMEKTIFAVKEYREKYKNPIELVFKEHPMDKGQINYENFYKKYQQYNWIHFLDEGNTESLVEKSDLVITVNSTVGLEAIEKFKKVICMGRAFYGISGIALLSCEERLVDDIHSMLNSSINKSLISNFMEWLKFQYSIEGNEYYYNTKHIKNICNYIRGS